MDDPQAKAVGGGRPAVVLLSGGLDSATCLAMAVAEGWLCHCLSFSYGQRHAFELKSAARIAAQLGAASHRVIHLDPDAFAGSALTSGGPVPKSDAPFVPPPPGATEIPSTYVPARNTIFLAYALGVAETLDAVRISIGVNAVDYSGYPDCRPAFIAAFQAVARLATRAGVEEKGPEIVAPLINMPKPEIIRRGLELGVDYGLTTSCYDPGPTGAPCGRCDACRIRAAAFGALGMMDPALEHESTAARSPMGGGG